MTAPTTTVRVQPAAPFNGMPDGFGAKIAFNRRPAIQIWEKKMKPFTMDGGDPVDQSTNWNNKLHTFSTRVLSTFSHIVVEAGYDSDSYDDIYNGLLNAEGSITIYWRSGAKLDFYGALIKAEPSDLEDANKPMLSLTIAFTNRDASGNEVAPVYTAVSGT